MKPQAYSRWTTGLALVLLGLLAWVPGKASHMQGGEIWFDCVNPCTTRVYVAYYWDCAITSVFPHTVRWGNTSPGCVAPVAIGAPVQLPSVDINWLMAMTSCSMGSIPGYEMHVTYQDWDVCGASNCDFDLIWEGCCRDPGLTSQSNFQTSNLWMATRMNPRTPGCNNSPRFLYPPTIHADTDHPFQLSFGAWDPDGDSLAYELFPCLFDSVTWMNYAVGYSPTQPAGPGWAVQLDPGTGNMTFTPTISNPPSRTHLCVAVKEYRNGVMISRVVREHPLEIVQTPLGAAPLTYNLSNFVGSGVATGDVIHTCAPTPICFDLTGYDVDPGQNLTLTWTRNLVGGVFSEVGNSTPVDTVFGTSSMAPAGNFCWTPPANGHYSTMFILQDDVGQFYSTRTVSIHVGSAPATATATLMTCPTVQFQAQTCSTGTYTFAWSGSGGLSSTLQSPQHTYPGPGTYAWQVIVNNGMTQDTVQGSITVPAGPSYQSMLSQTSVVMPCLGTVYDTLAPTGSWSSYQWSTGSTSPQLQVSTGGWYRVTVTDAAGCIFYDSTYVTELPADIAGYVSTSTGAPLIDQNVYLILYDTLLQALYALDSIQTDSAGYYYFCNITDTIVFVKATPDSLDYPNQMPTYADSSLFWSGALQMFPLTQSPIRKDFSTLFGSNPGGPGFIGGLIVQGANKTNAIGDPVPGVRIFLIDRNSGAVLGYDDSDQDGYISFANVPLGDYALVPDLYPRSVTNVPQLTLDAQHPQQDSLDLQLHWTWLELVVPTGGTPAPVELGLTIAPNPFGGFTWVKFLAGAVSPWKWRLYDAQGRLVQYGNVAAGQPEVEVGAGLPAGVYHLTVGTDEAQSHLKLVKVEE